MLSVQPGFDPVAGQLEPVLAPLDLEPQKLEAFRDMHNPGLLPVERHAKLVEDLRCLGQGILSLGPGSTGHYPVVRPPREPVSLLPHLLVKRSKQDIAQQRRYHSLNAKGNFDHQRLVVLRTGRHHHRSASQRIGEWSVG